jgi:hypothetical protein
VKLRTCLAAAAALAITAAGSAQASTGVFGQLYFGSDPLNYYLAANGYVPADFNNEFGNPVAIDDGVEFGFQDGHNLDAADFTGTSLTLYDFVSDEPDDAGSAAWVQKFTSVTGMFNGLTLVSSNFQGLTYSLAGDTLTVNWDGTTGGGYYQADFTFNGVPEPATWAMMITGFGMAGVALRRRRRGLVAA